MPPTLQQAPWTHAFTGDSRTPRGKSPVGSLLLSPGSWCTRFCCALQESISQSCVSSGSSTVGLMATSSKRAYATPTPEPVSLWQTTADPHLHRKCSNTVLFQSLWGPWLLVHTRFFEPSEHLWQEWGLILNTSYPLLPSCWGFSFALGCGVAPHSCSSAYHLTGVFLTLDVSPNRKRSTSRLYIVTVLI